MADLLTLAKQCETATADMQRDLLERAWQSLYGEYPGSQIHTVSPRGIAMGRLINASAYVDAALMFVPEGWRYSLGTWDSGGAWAWVGYKKERRDSVEAATPALAILAASIRARADRSE